MQREALSALSRPHRGMIPMVRESPVPFPTRARTWESVRDSVPRPRSACSGER